MLRGVHGEKIISATTSKKMPLKDVPKLKEALKRIHILRNYLKDL